jgi:hypothetical protein
MLKKEKIILQKSTKKQPFFGFCSTFVRYSFRICSENDPFFRSPFEQIPNETRIKPQNELFFIQFIHK